MRRRCPHVAELLLRLLLLLLLLSSSSVVPPADARDMFSAMAELTNALRAEDSVAKELQRYVDRELVRIGKLQTVAKQLQEHSQRAMVDPVRYLSNPVNAYLLVKKFAVDWREIVDLYIRPNTSRGFLDVLFVHRGWLPDTDDLEGSALALLRLQDVYDLTTHEIATGNMHGVVQSSNMNADDCLQLGMIAYSRDDFYHAILWLRESLTIDLAEETKTTTRPKTLDYLSYAMYRQGNVYHAYNLTKEWLSFEPENERGRMNLKYYEKMIQEQKVSEELKFQRSLADYQFSKDYGDYEKLCRGETTHSYLYEHRLTCQYRRHAPMFYLKPLREELFYLDPQIAIYHDVISDREMKRVKDLALPQLKRSEVFHMNKDEFIVPEYRTSKTSWLADESDPVVERIAKRASTISNLTLDTAEFLQVLNYGIGGQYEPHYDFARPGEEDTFEEWRGNRVATVIFYISDVEAGGATVFNDLGVRLSPKKGAAAIWYNLLRNGKGDFRTRHAGCPVLSGTKWVCNKWFHVNGQEFLRKCSLSPDE